ncbi:MAG TPA: LysM domain-containing protein [Solirubrobacteraceae bacterium]|nr:LysM domain-containing protein [Solirubrobacteraceae bacterium]
MVGKSARFLAPVALVAVALGVYLLVHSALRSHPSTASHSNAVLVNGRRQATTHKHHGPKFYVVKAGDTLSSIAAKTGVSMSRLTALNKSLAQSPNSLQTGQRLRLRH